MAVRSGYCPDWNYRANHYLNHADCYCRFHGQLSSDRATLQDQHLRNLPESARWSGLELLLNHQYRDDHILPGNAQRNVSDRRSLYGNGNQWGLSAANSSAASWIHEEKT